MGTALITGASGGLGAEYAKLFGEDRAGLTSPREFGRISDSGQTMDEAMISQVRSFNRLVTQRVHALDDRFLARDRPLGESRVLWEIGAAGCDVCDLRSRLHLHSGYLSPLLPSLQRARPGRGAPSRHHRRVRIARP